MSNENEKKGLFERLTGGKKEKKNHVAAVLKLKRFQRKMVTTRKSKNQKKEKGIHAVNKEEMNNSILNSQ